MGIDLAAPDEDPTFGTLEGNPHPVLRPIGLGPRAPAARFAVRPVSGQAVGEGVVHLPTVGIVKESRAWEATVGINRNRATIVVQAGALHGAVGVVHAPAGSVSHAVVRDVVPGMGLDSQRSKRRPGRRQTAHLRGEWKNARRLHRHPTWGRMCRAEVQNGSCPLAVVGRQASPYPAPPVVDSARNR